MAQDFHWLDSFPVIQWTMSEYWVEMKTRTSTKESHPLTRHILPLSTTKMLSKGALLPMPAVHYQPVVSQPWETTESRNLVKLPTAFSALMLLVGQQEGHWVVGCWHGYLSGPRCRFAYGPADATATHYLLLVNTDWFYLSGASSLG